jgi:hypothetical protein
MDSFNLIDENIALALQRELNVILSIACEALCRNPTDLSERLEHEGCADVRKRAQPYSCLNMPYRVWRAALNNQVRLISFLRRRTFPDLPVSSRATITSVETTTEK